MNKGMYNIEQWKPDTGFGDLVSPLEIKKLSSISTCTNEILTSNCPNVICASWSVWERLKYRIEMMIGARKPLKHEFNGEFLPSTTSPRDLLFENLWRHQNGQRIYGL